MQNNSSKSNSALALWTLLGTSLCVSLITSLAKVAHIHKLEPMPFMFWSLCLASLVMLSVSGVRHESMPYSKNALSYYFWSALLSVAIPNLVLFMSVPKIGVSFVALTMCLPPLLTYIGAVLLKLEKPSLWRVWGVVLSLAGAFILVNAQWKSNTAEKLWIFIALIAPVVLSMGNIYRTLHWPKGSKPEALAPGMMCCGALLLLIFGLISPGMSFAVQLSPVHIGLIILQAALFAAQYLLLFMLQKAGGPVFLSLLGTLSAAISVPVATLLLNEPLLKALIPSALLILIGIFMMIKGQKAQTDNAAA